MILVLSCVDLIVVTVAHPLQIFWTIFWFMEISHEQKSKFIGAHITSVALGGFSMFALLTR